MLSPDQAALTLIAFIVLSISAPIAVRAALARFKEWRLRRYWRRENAKRRDDSWPRFDHPNCRCRLLPYMVAEEGEE